VLFSAFSLCTATAVPEQHVLSSSPLSVSRSPNRTIVDVLAQDGDYSMLVYLLQRARLIPSLNRLNASTLFAPTNDAIKSAAGSATLSGPANVWSWAQIDSPPPDNVQAELRANLLYHMLNFTLPFSSTDAPAAPDPAFFETLLVPSPDEGRGRPGDPPDNDETSHGLLGGHEGQKIRIARRGDESATFVGVDSEGRGGAKVVKSEQAARNGVVIGVGEVLRRPPNIGEFSVLVHLLLVEVVLIWVVVYQPRSFRNILTSLLYGERCRSRCLPTLQYGLMSHCSFHGTALGMR
jgi:uncharacterized surface protein with fasciclin (FAS1) repeats